MVRIGLIEGSHLQYFRKNYEEGINKLLTQLSSNAIPIDGEDFALNIFKWNSFFYLAIDSDDAGGGPKIVGMALIFFQYRPEGWLGEIHSVVVDNAYRGQGLGKQLTQKLLDKAKEFSGCHQKKITLELTSSPKRVAANALYLKLGFELVAAATGEHGTNLYKKVIEP